MSRLRIAALEIPTVGIPLAAVLMSHPTPYTFALPAAVVACLALPLRLWSPWLALLACLPALVGGLGWPPSIIALYRVGRTSGIKWVAGAVALSFLTLVLPLHIGTHLDLADRIMSLMFSLVAVAGPAAFGVLVRLRRDLTSSLTQLEQARRAELEARADQAKAEERTRISREIHDAVGHNATLIAIQAAALAATTTDPQAKQTADHLRQLAKQSLTEMRAALGLTTSETRRGLSDIPTLITQAQTAGVQVTYDATTPTPTTPLIDRAVYRVVQEALTNTAKHAPGAPVQVTITNDPLHVSVINGTATTPLPDLTPSGTGLQGLTERVNTAGGTLTAGPLPDGGFSVQATFPTQGTPKSPPTHSTFGGTATPHLQQ